MTKKSAVAIVTMFAVALFLLALCFTSHAKASPYPDVEVAVCEYLDTNPTYYGVQSMIRMAVEKNVDPYAFADVVVDAVTYRCPEYYNLVKYSTARTPSRYKDYIA